MKYSASVIIMTLNAESYIRSLLEMLKKQTYQPLEVIVADSQSEDKTVEIAQEYDFVKIISIQRKTFDHGGSRDYALRQSKGDIVLFLTQDAEIGNESYVENMIKNFENPSIAMVCGRQIAKKNARKYEKWIRAFNYPDQRIVREKADVETMGVKAFYMSDVCSAYKRSIYEELGGFEHPILTNEDMLIAKQALDHDYKTAYDPSAYVYHSHNYSLKQEYKRNFDVSAFMTMHEKDFQGISVTSEGFKLVKYVSIQLLSRLQFISFVHFGFICVAKLAGNRKGKQILSMSQEEILATTSNRTYWLNRECH